MTVAPGPASLRVRLASAWSQWRERAPSPTRARTRASVPVGGRAQPGPGCGGAAAAPRPRVTPESRSPGPGASGLSLTGRLRVRALSVAALRVPPGDPASCAAAPAAAKLRVRHPAGPAAASRRAGPTRTPGPGRVVRGTTPGHDPGPDPGRRPAAGLPSSSAASASLRLDTVTKPGPAASLSQLLQTGAVK